MGIEYKTINDIGASELERLFLSVGWSSGYFPDKLAAAMKNYETVITAWDGERLVGLLSAMDDGVMTAYIHYLLVDPEYQDKKIGRTLVEMSKEKYRDFLRIVLIAYNKEAHFYEQCGFRRDDESSPMFITSLWT